MKNFQLVSEDHHSFTVKHPDGTHLRVAKAGLTVPMMTKMRSMPALRMADGGEVPDPEATPISTDPNDPGTLSALSSAPVIGPTGMPDGQSAVPDYGSMPFGTGDTLYGTTAPATPDAPSPDQGEVPINIQADQGKGGDAAGAKPALNVQPVPGTGPDASAASQELSQRQPQTDGGMATLQDALNQEIGGIQRSAKAKAEEQQGVDKAYRDYQAQAAQMQAQYANQRKQVEGENQQLYSQIQSGKIDPNRLWHEASTGNKILAGIGILLGGIGSGLTGQPNQALAVIQKMTDRDVEAQREDLGNKRSLLANNMQRYRDINQAELATRLQLNTALQAQISQAAAKAGTKQAMANAQVMVGQLKMQAAPMAQQFAMMRAKAVSMGAGGGEGGLPVGQEPPGLLMDKGYLGNRVVVNGRAYQTNSPTEGETMRSTEAQAGPILKLVHQLDSLGPSAAIPGTEQNQVAHAIRARLATAIPMFNGSIAGVKRINESEIKQAEQMVRDPKSFSQMLNGGARNQAFFKGLEDEIESARRAKLVGYKGMSKYKSYTPMGPISE